MRPTRQSRRASSTSSMSGWSGKPPTRSKTSRRTNSAWSPYGKRVTRDRRSARRRSGPSQPGPSSAMVRTRKAPATTAGSASVRATHVATSPGSDTSACRKSSTSPCAARAPAFSCVPRPRGAAISRTPGARRTTSVVPSLLPPSTTTTSSTPAIDRNSASRWPMRCASSRTGTTTESRTGSRQRAAAARACSGGAAEAVRSGRHGGAVERRQVVQVPHRACPVPAERQLQHLVEVAVVETSVVADADERPTHETVHRRGIEVVHEERHVALRRAPPGQLLREPVDRHVRDRQQAVEGDTEAVRQLAAVVGLELLLWRRQVRAHGIVDQVEPERRSRRPVAEAVQQAQDADAALEHSRPALRVDVLRAVARQARDDLDAVRNQERGQVLVSGLEQHRQVAAVDDATAEPSRV